MRAMLKMHTKSKQMPTLLSSLKSGISEHLKINTIVVMSVCLLKTLGKLVIGIHTLNALAPS